MREGACRIAIQRRSTRQRRLISDVVHASRAHPTADEVYLLVRERDRRISRGTVYRNLNLLAEEGSIQIIKTPAGNRFDGRTEEHAHLVCVACGAVTDVSVATDAALDDQVARETGCVNVSHYTIFEGMCATCLRARRACGDRGAQRT